MIKFLIPVSVINFNNFKNWGNKKTLSNVKHYAFRYMLRENTAMATWAQAYPELLQRRLQDPKATEIE